MTPSEAIEFFGSATEVARICDVSLAAVYNWGKRGGIPYDKQCQIQIEAEKLAAQRGRKRYPTANRKDAPEKQAA